MSLKKNCVRCIGYNKNEKSRTFKRKLFLGTSFSHFKASRQQVKTRNVDLWPTLQPATVGFFLSCYSYSVILTVTQYLDFHCLVQKTCDCHLLWRLSEGEKTDTIYSSEHVQWDAFFTSVFVMISAVFCWVFFHGQIVWNLFIVGKLVEKKAASEMISFIAFFPSNLIPVPGLLFNAHMKC